MIMAPAAQIFKFVEEYAGFSNDTSAEKIHRRQAAITREEADAKKLLDWFTDYIHSTKAQKLKLQVPA